MDPKYHFSILRTDEFDYSECYKEKWSDKEELDNLPQVEGNEEQYYSVPSTPLSKIVKERKWFEILTPKKLLTRLPKLLVSIKAGNNSSKLKNKIKQILYLLYQHNKIIKKAYNNLIKSL